MNLRERKNSSERTFLCPLCKKNPVSETEMRKNAVFKACLTLDWKLAIDIQS